MIIACIISFVIGAMVMMCAIGLMSCQKDREPKNKVKFYICKNPLGELVLWMGKPMWSWKLLEFVPTKKYATFISTRRNFYKYKINEDDFKDMRNEEIREIYLNLED